MTAQPVPDWLADPALRPVWDQLRAPLERGRSRLRLAPLPRETRHALAGVLGRPVIGTPLLMLGELSEELEGRAGLSLRDLVAALTGPLRDVPAERAASARRRGEPLDLLAVLAGDLDRAWVPAWVDAIRGSGLLTREPDWERTVRSAVAVVDAVLDAEVPRSRKELAAACAHDAHALDPGAPVTGLVLRALALELGAAYPRAAEERRALWDRAGVLPDLVSQTVLTLGLRRGCGPVHLTAWDLRQEAVAVSIGTPVLVCENPAVLEGFAEVPDVAVVCGSGSPTLLCLQVLDVLTATGAELRYHGDFDWPGIGIANRLVARCGVAPWKMSAADYRSAARPGALPLSGGRVAASWDSELLVAMADAGVAVHEEQVLSGLVAAWVQEIRPHGAGGLPG